MAPKTHLGACAFHCAPGALKRALKAGADPDERDPDTQRTPLMWLCEMHDAHTRSRKRMWRRLLQAGADLHARDHAGMTAVDVAKWGAARAFRRFVEREARRLQAATP